MSEFVVKKKKKLERIEIIPLEKAKLLEDLIYNPFLHSDDNFEFEEVVEQEEEIIPPEPVELKQTFSREFRFTNLRKPQEIDLRRVPPVAVLKEQHDKEIGIALADGYNACFNELTPKFNKEKAQLEEWIRSFDLVTEEMNTQFSLELKNFEETLLNLSIIIAEHILEKEITAHSSIVIDQVRKAIASVEEDKVFKIVLNPANIKTLENVKSTLFSNKSKADGIKLIPDESVDLGGCILETSIGLVDARIKTQLEIVANQIFNSGIEEVFDAPIENEKIEDFSIEESDIILENIDDDKAELLAEDEIVIENDDENFIEDEKYDFDEFENSKSDITDDENEITQSETDFLNDLQHFDFGEDND